MDRKELLHALLHADRTLVMGVLNITEDSFSDGGLYLEPDKAVAHAQRMIEQGADIIDIGAESTRPGAVRVPEEVEKQRVVGAVAALAQAYPHIGLSVDTTRSSVAAAAIEAGAHIINDVSGGQLDADIMRVVAESDCLYIVQHWRAWLDGEGEKKTTTYEHGVTDDVYVELEQQVTAVLDAGVPQERIIIDPGLGFSKPTIEHNLPLVMGIRFLSCMGYPVLIGASRKRFIGQIVEQSGQADTQAARDDVTAQLSVLAAAQGAWAVRVHDVPRNRMAVQIAQDIEAF
ncbi:dihydropteroate synthase [Alloscardovia omnicolens]|uniref:dihydropteroate synthase n=1 Tax=Alloscardovia omnicolens TaxID=419015 RepID=UPI003A613C2A